ncbi:DUF6612 family protein [Paenibacillus sp. YPG26]|uniref:DUF6612 family protein n=1 Tax=Paenibacillus sp. YPG26 TaxID=2878915 RepID=UPI0020414813|nr:DUF6612 family protein [Paenibacillus sp. YPG26]USB33348.1 hypothetical protein LDO05_00440 [Paenibacillus sp. YPG26]
MRKIMGLTLTLLLSVVLVLSGCSSKKDPKEALQGAAANALKMDSYVLKNEIKIKDLSVNMAQSNEQVGSVVNMLKDAEININQIYQKAPMQTESTLEIKLKGDVATTITIPFVLTKEKMYVKIPKVPFFPIPDSIVGKFLVLDFKELAEQSGNEFNVNSLDPAKSQKLGLEIANAVFAEYDSAKYFKDVDSKDAALPEGFNAKQVVQFNITNDNVKEAVTIFVNKALPKILDIISKDEYRELLQLTKEEIDQAKKDIQSGSQAELNKAIDDMKNHLKINQFTVNTAIDKNDFPAYQNLNTNLEINNPDTKDNVKVAVEAKSTFTKINEKQNFVIGIPTDVITMDELQQQFGAAGLQ